MPRNTTNPVIRYFILTLFMSYLRDNWNTLDRQKVDDDRAAVDHPPEPVPRAGHDS